MDRDDFKKFKEWLYADDAEELPDDLRAKIVEEMAASDTPSDILVHIANPASLTVH
jgi:hypothetical protein